MVTRQPHLNTQILPLENGDRLSRHEFERRYTASPDVSSSPIIIEGYG